MTTEQLAQQVYELAIQLWYKSVYTIGGHPGPAGPSSSGCWSMTDGNLQGAITALKDILEKA